MSDPADQLQRLQDEVAALRQDIHGLLEAWRTASGVVRAVKWVGKLATAVAAIYALFKLGAHK